jgi:hypothetical protein
MRLATIVVLFASVTAMAAPAVSLEPADVQDLRQPFREVRFTAQNTTAGIVRAISFRSGDGGPTMLVDAVIPPGGKLEGVVPLPALSPNQTYDVTLLSSAEPAAGGAAPQALLELQADINWLPEMINADRFVNWRYDQAQFDAVTWPAELKRSVLLVLVLGSLAMAAVWLVGGGTRKMGGGHPWPPPPDADAAARDGRRAERGDGRRAIPAIPRLAGYGRWLALGLIVGGTTVAGGWVLGRAGVAVNQSSWVTSGERTQPLLAAGSRRTIQAVYNSRIVPVYVTKEQMRNDSTVIHVGREATVTLRPGSVYLFEQPEEVGPQPLPPGGVNLPPPPMSSPSSSPSSSGPSS